MANIWATKNGNWSDTTVWNLGRLPTNGDVVAANGYAVTIDMDLVGQYAPAAIQTSNIGGTAGGGFIIASNRQIGDANNVINIGGSGSTTTVITIQSGNYNVTFYANITGGSSPHAYGINNNSTGTVTVTGNVTGGSGLHAYGINNNSTGTVTVTGNVTGGSGLYAYGINNNSTGTVTVTGNVTGGSNSYAYGIHNNSTGTVTVTGNVVPASSTNVYGIYNNSTGTITINGDVYGGRNQPSVYANNGLIIINGDLRWNETYSNTAAIGTTVDGKIILNGNIRHLYATTGNYGMTLTSGRVLMRNGGNTYTAYAEDNGSGVATGNPVMHYGTNLHSGSMPSETDVRYGTSYGPGNSRTGTCRVPPPQSVLYGVPVDNTVGTATIDADSIASAVWNAVRSSYSTPGTFGAVSEWTGSGGSGTTDWTDEEKKQIRHRLGIDGDSQAPASGVPSLLSAVGYTAARATKLDNLDTAVSSRSTLTAADVWSYATRTLSGFAFQVTVGGYTTGQSPSEQLQSLGYSSARAAKLDNLDAAVSSRLAASAYIAPDNTSIAAIKSQTDKLSFIGSDVKATLDGETVIVSVNNDKTGYSLTADYDRAKTALSVSEYVAPDNTSIAAIKSQTDKLSFAGTDVKATLDGEAVDVDEQAIADAIVSAIGDEQLVQVIVTPIAANLIQQATHGGHIESWTHARITASWTIPGNDLSGHDLRMIIYKPSDPTTRVAEFKSDTGLTVSYDSGTGQSTISLNADPISAGSYAWIIRDQTTDTVILKGTMVVYAAPDAS